MLQKFAGDVILSWGWKRNGLAFLSGLLLMFALPPFDFFIVGFVSFPLLLWLLEGAVARPGAHGLVRHYPAAVIGWFFGFGYFLGGLWWIGNALFAEGREFLWALPLAVLALPAGLALFFSLGAVLARMVWGRGIGAAAALAFGFGITEWLRAFLLTGFPWNGVGLTAMPVPELMQSTGIFGISGVNALAVFLFALPGAAMISSRRWTGPSLAATLLIANAAYGIFTLNKSKPEVATATSKIVRMVQPSIAQSEKWDEAARDTIFKTYLDLTLLEPDAGKPIPSLIVWPETAVPFILSDRPDALTAIGEAIQDGQTLLAGAVRQEGVRENGDMLRYYNSMLVINAQGEIIDAADKAHLVPFGEYLPLDGLLRSLGLDEIVSTPGGFTAGPRLRVLDIAGIGKILPLICYEIIFPGTVVALKNRPEVIINITNDAWYGRTPGPWQHFRLAQIQAAESGVPIIRVANNGISGVIDKHGRILSALDLNAVGVLDAVIPQETKRTVYSFYRVSVTFLVFGVLMLLAGLTNWRSRSRMHASVY